MEETNRLLSVLQNSLSGGQILRWPRADVVKKQGGIETSLGLCPVTHEAVRRQTEFKTSIRIALM